MNTLDTRFVSTLDVTKFFRLPGPRSNRVSASTSIHGQARFALTAEPPEPKIVSFRIDQLITEYILGSISTSIKLDFDGYWTAISPYIALKDERTSP